MSSVDSLLLVMDPAHYSVGDKALGVGVGMTACAFGIRHASDADHTAAIDNTPRKSWKDGQSLNHHLGRLIRSIAQPWQTSRGRSCSVLDSTRQARSRCSSLAAPVQRPESVGTPYRGQHRDARGCWPPSCAGPVPSGTGSAMSTSTSSGSSSKHLRCDMACGDVYLEVRASRREMDDPAGK